MGAPIQTPNVNVMVFLEEFNVNVPIEIISCKRKIEKQTATIDCLFVSNKETREKLQYIYFYCKKPSNGQKPYGLGLIKRLNGTIYFDPSTDTNVSKLWIYLAIVKLLEPKKSKLKIKS